jgi:hypothetical protein
MRVAIRVAVVLLHRRLMTPHKSPASPIIDV